MSSSISQKVFAQSAFADSVVSPFLSRQLESSPDMAFRIDAGGRLLDYRPGRGSQAYIPASDFLDRLLPEVLEPEVAASVGKTRSEIIGVRTPDLF